MKNIEDLVDRAIKVSKNRYYLVSLASKRARQLVSGYAPLVEKKFAKPTSISLLEIAEGKIKIEEEVEE